MHTSQSLCRDWATKAQQLTGVCRNGHGQEMEGLAGEHDC